MSGEEVARLEGEMKTLEQNVRAVDRHPGGEKSSSLTLAQAHVKRLLENGKVVRLLIWNYPYFLGRFEIVEVPDGVVRGR